MKIKKISVLQFKDALFHHDSAALLPSQPAGPSSKDGSVPSPATLQAEGLLSAIVDIHEFLDENPNKKLIIVDNTDTTDKAGYNFNLSMLRASSVLHLLEDEKMFVSAYHVVGTAIQGAF